MGIFSIHSFQKDSTLRAARVSAICVPVSAQYPEREVTSE